MAITNIKRDWGDCVCIVRIVSDDTLATVAAANYILDQADNIIAVNNGEFQWEPTDFVLVSASDAGGLFSIDSDFASLVAIPATGNGAVTLPVVSGNFTTFDGTLGALGDLGYAPSNAAKTKVVMANGATVSGHLAVFTDTAGTVDDSADGILSGNLTLGGYNLASVANALTAHAGGGQASALQLAKQINRVTVVATAGDSVKLPVSVAGMQVVVINADSADAMDVFPASGEVINALAADTAISVAADKTIIFNCAVAGIWNSVLTA